MLNGAIHRKTQGDGAYTSSRRIARMRLERRSRRDVDYAPTAAVAGWRMEGSSLLGEFTRVEIGHILMSADG